MKVCVRLFAVAKQAAGRDLVELELPDGATIAQLRRELAARVPQLSGFLGQMTFALDARYAADDALVPAGAEIACIPPVSGG